MINDRKISTPFSQPEGEDSKETMEPENAPFHFLVACSRVESEAERRAEIGEALSRFESAEALIALSARHGVLPLVYSTLKNLSSDTTVGPTIDSELLARIKAAYLQVVRHNMLLGGELLKMTKLFQKQGIETLAFKGPILAQIAYGDITLRQFGDLDIFVKRANFRKVAELLTAQGYQPRFPIETFSGEKVMFEMNNDCPFYDRKRGIAVEIHWDFFRKLALPTERLHPWEHRRTVSLNGTPVTTLSDESHLLYHSLHGSKHLWERFIWIVDIDRLIRATPDLDWERVLEMAESMGAKRMFLLGPALASHYLHTPLPVSIQKLCREAQLEEFIDYVDRELRRTIPTPEESLGKLKKVIALRDTFYYKTLTLLEFLFRPGINERRTIVLSDRFFGLYWLLRPVGMSWRFLYCRLLKLCG